MKEHNVIRVKEEPNLFKMEPGSTSLHSDDGEKLVMLPKQLEAVTRATSMPKEVHRWNTNEEVASILIAFDRHKEWIGKEVLIKPPSGSMLLYNRKKARYRKDGYCWKKRKDGKTTREDHMKLKVQGVECIYGCYVHSAIMPTFHRRCYWLLQNPDVVLVHYLNVLPMQTDDNKVTLPSLTCTDKKDWTREELISQLRPMCNFASMGHFSDSSTEEEKQAYMARAEATLQEMVSELIDQQKSTQPKEGAGPTKQISPKADTIKGSSAVQAQNQLMCLLQKQKAVAAIKANENTAAAVGSVSHQNRQASQPPGGPTSLIINSHQPGHHISPRHTAPLFLNLSQLQGSNGLIIVSSQSGGQISILNNQPTQHLQHHTQHNNIIQQQHAPQQHITQQSENQSQEQHQNSNVNNAMSVESIPQHGSVQPVVSLTQTFCSTSQPVSVQRQHDTSNQLQTGAVTITNGQVPTSNGQLNTQTHVSLLSAAKQQQLGQGFGLNNIHNGQSTALHQQHSQTGETSRLPGTLLPGMAPNTVSSSGSRAPSGESSMDVASPAVETYPSHLPEMDTHVDTSDKPTSVSDLVTSLNVKNEMHQFGEHHLSNEDLMSVLSNNLQSQAVSGQQVDSTPTTSIPAPNMVNIESLRSSMVSPPNNDLFDLETILDQVLPDLDSDTITSDMSSTPTPSSGFDVMVTSTSTAAMTTSSSSSTCNGFSTNSTQSKAPRQQAKSSTKHDTSRAGIANITDYSPEWSYPEGGVKILVTGPWYSTTSPYTILFDGVSVEAELVQSGVLRCFCPDHNPGMVSLQVACEGYIISNSCLFEYKAREEAVEDKHKEWFRVPEDHLKIAILEKIEEIERRLIPASQSLIAKGRNQEKTPRGTDAFENRLMDYVENLRQRQWKQPPEPFRGPTMRLTLLHLATALGYNRLITALIRFKTDNPSLIMDYEVDPLSIDDRACNPLMWACARGKLDAAVVLYKWKPNCLATPNRDGQHPLAVARMMGHSNVAQALEYLEAERQRQQLAHQNQQHSQQQQLKELHISTTLVQSQIEPLFRISLPPVVTTTPYAQPCSQSTSIQTFPTPPVTHTSNSIPHTEGLGSSSVQLPYIPLDNPSDYFKTPHARAPIAVGNIRQQQGARSPGDRNTPPGAPPTQQRHDEAILRQQRLLKRTSVEVLPGYSSPMDCFTDQPRSKLKQGQSFNDDDTKPLHGQHEHLQQTHIDYEALEVRVPGGPCLRTVNSDPHLVGLITCTQQSPLTSEQNPMISVNGRDLNSPFLMQSESNSSLIPSEGLTLDDIHREATAMETDSPRSDSPPVDMERLLDDEATSSAASQNQMILLANQIIAAMPERIKQSPAHAMDDNTIAMEDGREMQRERSSSHSSFSSYSSAATPPCADDSGISTPLEGLAYEEYRYPDLGTPASSLSPASTCLQSPYSFTLDSPPPTTEEFTEYFNAPAFYMEKDFSQLTLSDLEQRRLYEAAKVIQNFYRSYKDKQMEAQQGQKSRIEAAILIQSYYRRYKTYTYYKKMTQAAVLIQSQFRSYYAQKRFKRSRQAATVIQNQYRTYKQHERFKKSRNAAVIIQQRFRSHYQRKRSQEMARKMQQAVKQSGHSMAEVKDTDIEETAPPITKTCSAQSTGDDSKPIGLVGGENSSQPTSWNTGKSQRKETENSSQRESNQSKNKGSDAE